MRYRLQCECMNKECNTVILAPENRLDGISCPRCNGPVMPKPFEPYQNQVSSILMSSENHDGWKLEKLLSQVKSEVSHKINKIIDDPLPQAQLVVRNNLAIIEHLGAAEALQRSSYVVLNAMGPNEGPSGTPRIGK